MTTPRPTRITAAELLEELRPRLALMERLVANTLAARDEATDDPRERLRREESETEFRLELQMIRLNLESLMRRHAETLVAAEAGDAGAMASPLSLDAHEAVAIQAARRLFARLQAHQQG